MNNDVTVTELRQAKLALEDELARRLEQFSQQTGVKVAGIGLTQVHQSRSTGYLLDLKLEM